MEARSLIFESGAGLEKKACRINDPIERLRYLRQEAARNHCNHRPAKRRLREPKRWLQGRAALFVIAVTVIAVGIGPIPMGTAETTEREQRLVIPMAVELPPVPSEIPRVWRVEKSETTELYSNGLRVDLTFTVSNRPRAQYPVFPLNGGAKASKTGSQPVGIVYHTSESLVAPFEEQENRRLRQLGRNLLEVIRTERAYHYLIDRFGRVFRVVEETDAANHSGHSVWADSQGIYVNLNDSFLAVSFEGQTDAVDEVTPAQIASGRVLTEMLRSRYRIPAENCVTHAQVSVNSSNMHIGSHIDWAGKFPFAEIGLPDNYSIPLASMYAFGFGYDKVFLKVTGGRWRGVDLAEQQVARQAAAENLTVARYRAILQHRYKDIAASFKEDSGSGNPQGR